MKESYQSLPKNTSLLLSSSCWAPAHCLCELEVTMPRQLVAQDGDKLNQHSHQGACLVLKDFPRPGAS